jgi:hypothetical protein
MKAYFYGKIIVLPKFVKKNFQVIKLPLFSAHSKTHANILASKNPLHIDYRKVVFHSLVGYHKAYEI